MTLVQLTGSSIFEEGAPRPRARAGDPELSVIVPTRDEAANIAPLLELLEQAAPGVAAEIIFVDDSEDETPAAVGEAGARCTRDVGLIHRPPERRGDGLGGAVLEGLWAARGPWAVVMDGDLQHPPELIGELMETAQRTDADLVVASRRAPHGDADGLASRPRQVVSRAFTAMARGLFSRRLAGVSDPMSGFFLVRRDALDLETLRPHGFKVLLEILVRTPGLKVTEVPFHFGERHAGHSKADAREGMRFLKLLWRLRVADVVQRFARFGIVGLTGLVVNTLALYALAEGAGMYYLAAAILATQISTLWNFGLTDLWVFRGRESGRSRLGRLGLFAVMNNLALLLRSPVLILLTSVIGIHYLVSNLLSLGLLTIVRYCVADVWIWTKPASMSTTPTAPGSHSYDIHGLVSVRSQVALPELEGFRTAGEIDSPTIDVTVARIDPKTNGHAPGTHIRYREGVGFGVDIVRGTGVEVVASPALRYSPHVLYTNVVEPILRWTFVERGYALIHGACLADDGRALLITARTDTGKTTTTLKALEHASVPWAFLSDDLTLVAADGRVLAYPKPMTISRHTVAAVSQANLSWRERAGLRIQSKIHSRSGRHVAFRISRWHLPAATINLVVQALIPPPKYFVDRLVPGVPQVPQARLADMVVIQRGGDSETAMAPDDALETLLANCADAYGFPPYSAIEGFLCNGNGRDLKLAERTIIARALGDVRTTLLESSTMDWWRALPAGQRSGVS